MKSLDKNRPFATVHGEGVQPWLYEQDGHRFDTEGKSVGVDPDYKPPKGQGPVAAGVNVDVEAAVRKALEEREAEHKAELEAALAKQREELASDAASQLDKQVGDHKPAQPKKKK